MAEETLFAERMESGATLSDCERYRYHLWRRFGEGGTVAFVMLNPSTADATADDPTIRKCIGFAKRWGYGRVDVVNLFAWRATNPKELPNVLEPVGAKNNSHIFAVCRCADLVVFAWGSDKFARQRARQVRALLANVGTPTKALRLSKDGNPWHPLYVPYVEPLVSI